MNFTPVITLVHVLAAFGLVGGEFGRAFTYRRARQATDVKVAAELLQMSSFLSAKVVSGSGLVTVILGLATAWGEGLPILGFLQGGAVNWVLASLVLYGLIMVLVFGVQVPRAKALRQTLASAVGQGTITPELTAALHDRTVNNAYIAQDVLLVLIVVLMVLKPF